MKLTIRKRFPRGRWKKFHSCCDWFYKNDKTGVDICFCGLDLDRDKKMKEFEKGRKIYL